MADWRSWKNEHPEHGIAIKALDNAFDYHTKENRDNCRGERLSKWCPTAAVLHRSIESTVKNVSERDLGEAGRQEGASKDQQQGTQ